MFDNGVGNTEEGIVEGIEGLTIEGLVIVEGLAAEGVSYTVVPPVLQLSVIIVFVILVVSNPTPLSGIKVLLLRDRWWLVEGGTDELVASGDMEE